jgi:imidazole glycerol phosphate synthase subunit HisF
MQRGPDLNLISSTRDLTELPLLYSGGITLMNDALEMLKLGVDGLCLASALHYKKIQIEDLKSALSEHDIHVRQASN